MAGERVSRVLRINSPMASTLFKILRQFDMIITHFKTRLSEIDGISRKEERGLMTEGRDIVMAFSESAAKLSENLRFHPITPPENQRFSEDRKWSGS
jgi:hypothetical protein